MTVNIEYFMLDPWANTLHSSKPSTSVFPIQLFRFFMGPGSDNFLRFDSNSFAVLLLVKFPRGMMVETLFKTIPPSSCIGLGAWYYLLTWIDLWDIDRLSPNLKVLLCGWTCLCLYSSTLSTFSFCSSSMIECSLRSSTTLEREVELWKRNYATHRWRSSGRSLTVTSNMRVPFSMQRRRLTRALNDKVATWGLPHWPFSAFKSSSYLIHLAEYTYYHNVIPNPYNSNATLYPSISFCSGVSEQLDSCSWGPSYSNWLSTELVLRNNWLRDSGPGSYVSKQQSCGSFIAFASAKSQISKPLNLKAKQGVG